MRVLLSINPQHVTNILDGTKIFEFRRRIYKRSDVQAVLIYCTRPVGKIVGEFDVLEVIVDTPERLWRTTSHGSGISKLYFDHYFEGRERGYALRIGCVRILTEPISPFQLQAGFKPPQSYMYVSESSEIRKAVKEASFT